MKRRALPALAALIASGILQLLPAATEAGITWERRRFEQEHMRLHAAAVNDTGRIVAVGIGGVIRYSNDDGANWSTADSPTHSDLNSVCWDGSRFIAGGGFSFEVGLILTSSDGINWQRTCLGSAQEIFCVTGNGSRSLAMGFNGRCYATDDTTSWNGSPPASNDDYFGAVWAGTQFVRVGNDGLIETSPAGIAWTPRHSDPDQVLNAVEWNGAILVAVGSDSGSILPLVLTSPDGVTWTSQDMAAFPGGGPKAITWTGSHFVACMLSSQILTSPDGVNWSTHSAGPTALVDGLLWTGTSLTAVGEGGLILTAPTAAPGGPGDWTVRRHAEFEPTIEGLAQAEIGGTNRLVVVGSRGSIFYSDDDGITGIGATSGTTRDLHDVTDIPGGFIAVGRNGTVLSSSNGVSWTPPSIENAPPAVDLDGVTWYQSLNPLAIPHRAIAVGDSGTIVTADYGIGKWTAASSSTIGSLQDVASGLLVDPKPPHDASRLVVAVGDGGIILTSTTGTSWTNETSGTSENLYAVTPMPSGGFLAVGGHGLVLRSANGSTWTPSGTGTTKSLYDVGWTNRQFIAVGDNGVIFTSPTGTTWTRRYGRTNESLTSTIASPTGRIFAGGTQGVIISSDPATRLRRLDRRPIAPSGMDDPDDDPNGDGIDNLIAYGHGIPAVDPPDARRPDPTAPLVDPTPGSKRPHPPRRQQLRPRRRVLHPRLVARSQPRILDRNLPPLPGPGMRQRRSPHLQRGHRLRRNRIPRTYRRLPPVLHPRLRTRELTP